MSDNGTTALATRQPERAMMPLTNRGVQINGVDDLYRLAKAFASSGMAPKGLDRPESAFIAMELCLELGLPPLAAGRSVMVTGGKPSIYGDAALALIQRSGLLEYHREQEVGVFPNDDYGWKCTVKRKDKPDDRVQAFTIADAKVAKLWGKKTYKGEDTPWITSPKRMLKMRARAFALRDEFADVLQGLHVYEELIGTDDDVPTVIPQQAADLNAELAAVDAPKQLPQPANEPDTRQPEPDTEGVEAEPPEIPTNITREFVMAECERCNADAKAIGAWVKLNAPKSKFDNLDADQRLALVDAIRGGDYSKKGGE